MNYETICRRNKKLYAELENLSLLLISSDPEFIIKHANIIARKDEVKQLIANNLENLFIPSMPKSIRRVQERPYFKKIWEYNELYPGTPPAVIAGLCRIKVNTVNRVLNHHI